MTSLWRHHQVDFYTRGQRPNVSQKAVIIDTMWNSLRDNYEHFFGFFPNLGEIWPWVKVIGTWVIECTLLGCTLVPSRKCVGEIASEIWPVLHFFFTHFFGKFDLDLWPWPLTLTLGQDHRHLGHWMRLIGLYLGTKNDVCRCNSIPDMAHFVDFGSRSSALWSVNTSLWFVSWYQV